MANRIRDGLPASPLRLVLFAGLAAGVLAGAFASPAYAVNAPAATGSEARQAPASYQVAADERNRGGGRAPARGGPRGGGYRRGGGWVGGPGYYSAPPVVVAPYGYYAQPAPLFDLSIPIVIR
jgi:uncharacterized membrane protein YgcG